MCQHREASLKILDYRTWKKRLYVFGVEGINKGIKLIPCLFVQIEKRVVSLHSCSKALLPKRVPCVVVTCVATRCLTIPCMAHGKLHEMCMFHATRKCGLCKHVTGMQCRFFVAQHMWQWSYNSVVWYFMILMDMISYTSALAYRGLWWFKVAGYRKSLRN